MIDPNNILMHPRNAHIEFLPNPHKYFYTECAGADKVQFAGVTGLIGEYNNYFEKDKISKAIAARDHRTQEDVLAEWAATNKTAIDFGNYVHDALENFVKFGVIEDDTLIETFVAGYDRLGLTPVGAEWTIYDENIQRASSIDGNFVDPTGKFVIVDYKTNRKGVDFDSYKGQRMTYPLHELKDSKLSTYSLQVSMYRRWVENLYLDPSMVSNMHYILWIGKDPRGEWILDWIPALDLREQIQLIYNDLEAKKAYA